MIVCLFGKRSWCSYLGILRNKISRLWNLNILSWEIKNVRFIRTVIFFNQWLITFSNACITLSQLVKTILSLSLVSWKAAITHIFWSIIFCWFSNSCLCSICTWIFWESTSQRLGNTSATAFNAAFVNLRIYALSYLI